MSTERRFLEGSSPRALHGFISNRRGGGLPVPVDTARYGDDALFLFDCGGDAASCDIAFRSVARSFAAVYPDAPPSCLVLRSGRVLPAPAFAHLAELDPFRPERFAVALAGPRLVLCAVLRLWSRLAPRTAVSGGTLEPGLLEALPLEVRAVVAAGDCFLAVGTHDEGAEALLRAAALVPHRVDPITLDALATGRLDVPAALGGARCGAEDDPASR